MRGESLKELQQEIRSINVANGWDQSDEELADGPGRLVALACLAELVTWAHKVESIRKGVGLCDCPPASTILDDVSDRQVSLIIRLGLIATEVAEAIEGVVSGEESDHIPGVSLADEELSDILIRTLDVAEIYGVDLDEVTNLKLKYNRIRGYRHGGKAV